MNAYVDQETCIGCGLCCEVCPEVFRLQEDGKAKAAQGAAESEQESIQAAIDGCPVAAIRWME